MFIIGGWGAALRTVEGSSRGGVNHSKRTPNLADGASSHNVCCQLRTNALVLESKLKQTAASAKLNLITPNTLVWACVLSNVVLGTDCALVVGVQYLLRAQHQHLCIRTKPCCDAELNGVTRLALRLLTAHTAISFHTFID
jgi:hypothetical protein